MLRRVDWGLIAKGVAAALDIKELLEVLKVDD